MHPQGPAAVCECAWLQHACAGPCCECATSPGERAAVRHHRSVRAGRRPADVSVSHQMRSGAGGTAVLRPPPAPRVPAEPPPCGHPHELGCWGHWSPSAAPWGLTPGAIAKEKSGQGAGGTGCAGAGEALGDPRGCRTPASEADPCPGGPRGPHGSTPVPSQPQARCSLLCLKHQPGQPLRCPQSDNCQQQGGHPRVPPDPPHIPQQVTATWGHPGCGWGPHAGDGSCAPRPAVGHAWRVPIWGQGRGGPGPTPGAGCAALPLAERSREPRAAPAPAAVVHTGSLINLS